jgi:hypothetical protein
MPALMIPNTLDATIWLPAEAAEVDVEAALLDFDGPVGVAVAAPETEDVVLLPEKLLVVLLVVAVLFKAAQIFAGRAPKA